MDAAAQQAKDQAELNELVIWASARGLLADAEELVARGAELTTRDKHGRCPVHYAAAHGHLGMLQYLSRKGADLEAEDPSARLPLHHAAAAGKGVEALRYLIQLATWLNAPDGADDTPLHLAARKGWLDGVKLLLAAAAETDLRNKRGLSALGEAVAGGHVDAAEALLAAGADPTWRAGGYTLLHVAAGLGQTRTLDLLIRHLGPSSTLLNDSSNEDGATPLHAAAMAGSTAAVQLLLSHRADAGIAGADGTQAWELVPDGPNASSSAKQQEQGMGPAAEQQQGLQALRRELAEAARKAGRLQASRSSKVTTRSEVPAAGNPAADAAHSPLEAYSELFKQLAPAEQTRKVEGFARLPLTELRDVQHLSDAAKAAIVQVIQANQLLSVYRAVAALRADEQFQEDAADPQVQAALQDMGLHNNTEKYAGSRHIVSVATKLKKFHTVMQECGGVKLGLQDLLIPPGKTLADLTAQDAEQVQQLNAAAAAARAEAVAAITGQSLAEMAAGKRSVGKAQGVSASGGGEIEPVVEDGALTASLADAADNELDRELLQHKQAQAASLAASSNTMLQRVRRFLKPPREELEAMPFGQRMQYEMVNSFLQAVKIMLMMTAFMAVMWCLGLLPSQQNQAAMEAAQLAQQAADQAGAGLLDDGADLGRTEL